MVYKPRYFQRKYFTGSSMINGVSNYRIQPEELIELIRNVTRKFENANLELEQVQEINKNKQTQNEAYIEKTNQLKSILRALNEDTCQMRLEKIVFTDKETKLKQVILWAIAFLVSEVKFRVQLSNI